LLNGALFVVVANCGAKALLQFLRIRRSLFLRQDLTGVNSDVAKIVRGLSRRKANAYRRPTIQGGRQPTVRLLFTSG
jgi:hypothetical protein